MNAKLKKKLVNAPKLNVNFKKLPILGEKKDTYVDSCWLPVFGDDSPGLQPASVGKEIGHLHRAHRLVYCSDGLWTLGEVEPRVAQDPNCSQCPKAVVSGGGVANS